MSYRPIRFVLSICVLLACAATADASIVEVAKCQKKIAIAGANFAKRVIEATLKCTEAVSECQVQCEEGVYGAPCDPAPPPCCDPDDRSSNATFNACMNDADEACASQTAKIAGYEATKQEKILSACQLVTPEELCGAQGNGLNFAALNGGCLSLDPGYTCTLNNLIACLGGPLERALVDQISALLDPRAPDVVAALNLQSAFPDIPVARKAKGQVPSGKVDVWSISGEAGDDIKLHVQTRDDNGNDTSTLQPVVTLLASDGSTPVADTSLNGEPCRIPNSCGSTCPQLHRRLPFTGTFYVAIHGGGGCNGGKYRLIVVSPSGAVPVLVHDDVDP
jgi:hypothetical protein